MTVASLVQTNIIRSRSSVYKAEISQNKKVRRFLVMVLILAIIVFGFLYVFQTNNIAAKGYKIRDLEKRINELETINKTLQVEVSNLKSISILEAKSEILNMVKAKDIDYVSLPRTSAMLIE